MKQMSDQELDERIDAFLTRKSVPRSTEQQHEGLQWRAHVKDFFRPVKRIVMQ